MQYTESQLLEKLNNLITTISSLKEENENQKKIIESLTTQLKEKESTNNDFNLNLENLVLKAESLIGKEL